MGHKVVAALLIIAVAVLSIADAQFDYDPEQCSTPIGVIGKCINLKQCSSLLERLTSPTRQPSDIQYLQDSKCGFEGTTPKVCCPFAKNTTGRSITGFGQYKPKIGNLGSDGSHDYSVQQGNEFGPQGEKVEPRNSHSRQSGNFGQNCENTGQDGNPLEYLPTNCGQSDLPYRVANGKPIELGEHPWMALLEYRTHNRLIKTDCGGVLISKRHVLTAAHCLKNGIIPNNWKLESVRLGEYNTETERDCLTAEDGSKHCIEDPPMSVPIEKQFIHEFYSAYSIDKQYDIALLRLSQDVPFTNYIKPICLPATSNPSSNLTVAGWGVTERGYMSDVKLKAYLSLVDTRQCLTFYQPRGVTLSQGQLCARGQKGSDSCYGDSGGPLMQPRMGVNGTIRWEVAGIVSFGQESCGNSSLPGVYTNVYDYGQWILGKLRPETCQSTLTVPSLNPTIGNKGE